MPKSSQELKLQDSKEQEINLKKDPLKEYIAKLPKTELHVHIDGCLDADLMWDIYQRHLEKAKELGLKITCHTGEIKGTGHNIQTALKDIKVDRIDHGNEIINSKELMKLAKNKKIALTMSPNSNNFLSDTPFKNNPIIELFKKGLIVTINSDDPAYFNGYVNDNYYNLAKANDLTIDDLKKFSINSIEASFLSQKEKNIHKQQIEQYTNSFKKEYPNDKYPELYDNNQKQVHQNKRLTKILDQLKPKN